MDDNRYLWRLQKLKMSPTGECSNYVETPSDEQYTKESRKRFGGALTGRQRSTEKALSKDEPHQQKWHLLMTMIM
jgi:hypothetical protein